MASGDFESNVFKNKGLLAIAIPSGGQPFVCRSFLFIHFLSLFSYPDG